MHQFRPQEHSHLLCLPSEILYQIINLAICDGAPSQHIEKAQDGQRFMRIPCWPKCSVPAQEFGPDSSIIDRDAAIGAWRGEHVACGALHEAIGRSICRPLTSPLPLLLVCQQMHHEVSNVLYRSMTFIGLHTPLEFLQELPPDTLDRIRVLHLQWEAIRTPLSKYERNWDDWPSLCTRVGQLKSCQRVTVRMMVCNHASDWLVDRLLDPLEAAVQLGTHVEKTTLRDCTYKVEHSLGERGSRGVNVKMGDVELDVPMCRTKMYYKKKTRDRNWCGFARMTQAAGAARRG